MILDGKRTIYPDLINKKYLIKVCENKDKINLMIEYLKKNLNNSLIGIDFEFNRSKDKTKREIALMQISIDNNLNSIIIYLFNPNDLNEENLNILKKFLQSKTNTKIIHGGESLDIPYLFSEIFKTNQEQIEFCHNLYDTKYLCEYYNIENKLNENKCKIYYLLKQMNVVNNKQFDFLMSNEEKMGPIYNIYIEVKNLKKELILYSAFDVLFLQELYRKFPKNEIYQKLIPEISNVHFILKQVDFFDILTVNYNKFNLMFFYENTDRNTLVNIYQKKLKEYEIKFKNIIDITYFKKFFLLFIKYEIYKNLIDKHKIYERKNVQATEELLNFFTIMEKYINPNDFKILYNYLKK